MDTQIDTLSLLVARGNLEILKSLENSKKPLQFKHLRELINPDTSRKFSSSTIAQRLKDLEGLGTITNEIISANRRKSVGYTLTDTGKKTLLILRETETKLEKLKK